MNTFNYEFTVNASLEDVSAFHQDTSALKKLNPPPIIVQLHQVDPMAEASVSEFTLWMGPIPIRWRAIHSNVGVNGFTDTQDKGPMEYWKHTHSFECIKEQKTRIRETIEYRHPKGLGSMFTRLLFGKYGLTLLFAYRKWATIHNLGG